MKTYNDIVSCGDVILLKNRLNVENLKKQIEKYKFRQYNTNKPLIDRKAISITNNKDLEPHIDLESLLEINKKTGLNLRDKDFRDKTEVYYNSNEIKKVIFGFEEHLGRSHIIVHGNGGYFPPHRDIYSPRDECISMRFFVPVENCNPPSSYFMIDEKLQPWEHGRCYFINTNKMHHFMTYYGPATFIVFNVDVNEDSLYILLRNFESM